MSGRVVCACCLLLWTAWVSADGQFRLMSFNVWGAGANTGQSIDETLAVLRAANADIIGLQETRAESVVCEIDDCPGEGPSAAPALAAALGYDHYLEPDPSATNWYNAILSRYPIAGVLPGGRGVTVEVQGQLVHVVNLHNIDFPYQPYQLAGIAYADSKPLSDAAAAIESAQRARGAVLKEVLRALDKTPTAALEVIFGDFNEPSHRDWTEAAARAGRHPLAVAWPFTRRLENAGFIDAYRAVYPDEMSHPGFTWTPTTQPDDPDDHHDRIDYVFLRGEGVTVTRAWVVGERSPPAELVVTPWPSDHRAVLVEVQWATPNPGPE